MKRFILLTLFVTLGLAMIACEDDTRDDTGPYTDT